MKRLARVIFNIVTLLSLCALLLILSAALVAKARGPIRWEGSRLSVTLFPAVAFIENDPECTHFLSRLQRLDARADDPEAAAEVEAMMQHWPPMWSKQIHYLRLCWVAAWLPVLWVLTQVLRRNRGPYACRRCGYDLRATPDRCPECGRIPTKVKA